jgi:Ulp1 family protease
MQSLITVAELVLEKPPQQQNGYDCGLFSLLFTQTIAKAIGEGASPQKIREDIQMEASQKSVSSLRSQIQHLIIQLEEKRKTTNKKSASSFCCLLSEIFFCCSDRKLRLRN